MPSGVDPSKLRVNSAAGLLGALACIVFPAPSTAGVRHSPLRPASARSEVGRASYYGPRHTGKTTASGSIFAPAKLTAASPHLPLGTKARVTNLRNGRSVDVTLTDRGPVVGRRILDVSTQAADRLGMRKAGVATVRVEPIGEAKNRR